MEFEVIKIVYVIKNIQRLMS